MDRRLVIASAIVLACLSMYKVKGVCFYTDYNYHGEKVCGQGNVNLHGGPYDDKFKSLQLNQGESVVIFVDVLHGFTRTTIRDIPDLSSVGMDGKISSYIIYPFVCFYQATDFIGLPNCFIGKEDLSIVEPRLKYTLVSARVPKGYQVVIFNDDGFHGSSATLGPGNYATLEGFGVGVASLIVTPAYSNISMNH